MPRFAFTEPSMGSTTTCRAPPAPNVRSPELLGHEHEVLAERGETLDDRVLGRLVDRRRVVATLADAGGRARARRSSADARAPRGCRATHSRQTSSHGVTAAPGGRAGPRAAWDRSTCSSAASACPRERSAKTASTRGSRSRNATSAAPRSTAAVASSSARRVADAVEPVPVDELGVELSVPAADELDRSAPVRDGDRVLAALLVEPAKRLRERGARLALARLREVGPTARRPGESGRRGGRHPRWRRRAP